MKKKCPAFIAVKNVAEDIHRLKVLTVSLSPLHFSNIFSLLGIAFIGYQ
jgi:hypothetical protein